MKRIAIVTEQFWPHSGPTELALAELACRIAEVGNKVSIVTAKTSKEWPSYIEYRGISVHRIARFSAGPWASYRYARAFSRFFSQDLSQFDGIIIAGVGIATRSVVKAIGDQVPIVVHVGGEALSDGVAPGLHRRHWPVLENICAIVTACPMIAEQLHGKVEGVDVHLIESGVRVTEVDPTVATRSAARVALTDAHPILAIDAAQPLAIASVPLNRDAGIFDLLDAWEIVTESLPAAKLWVVGDGPHAGAIWRYITRRRLIHSVIMPGFFDELSDLVQAADLFVHPGRTPFASAGMIRAMVGQCCVVATGNSWVAQQITANESGLLAPVKNPSALAEAMLLAFGDREMRIRLAKMGKRVAAEAHSIETQAERYLELLFAPADHAVHSQS